MIDKTAKEGQKEREKEGQMKMETERNEMKRGGESNWRQDG